MNERQRQLVLLVGFMALLAVAFVFANMAGIERPTIGGSGDSGDLNATQPPIDDVDEPGPLKQSFSGLYSLYNASVKGWQDIAKLSE